jgi:hypothetical protein
MDDIIVHDKDIAEQIYRAAYDAIADTLAGHNASRDHELLVQALRDIREHTEKLQLIIGMMKGHKDD